MADEPTHAERLARIAEIERRLAESRAKMESDARARGGLLRDAKRLRKQVKDLERRTKHEPSDGIRPIVRNFAAALLAVLGLVAVLVGVGMQVRLLAKKARWVETTCMIRNVDDDGLRASPEGAAPDFAAPKDALVGAKIPCFIPDIPLVEALGRTTSPRGVEIEARDKIRKTYMLLVIEGLATIALMIWISIRTPAEDA